MRYTYNCLRLDDIQSTGWLENIWTTHTHAQIKVDMMHKDIAFFSPLIKDTVLISTAMVTSLACYFSPTFTTITPSSFTLGLRAPPDPSV